MVRLEICCIVFLIVIEISGGYDGADGAQGGVPSNEAPGYEASSTGAPGKKAPDTPETSSSEGTIKKKKKKNKSDRSTSSSSGAKDSRSDGGDSLSMSASSGSSSNSKEKDKTYIPKSSAERRGWRKWHRKCPKCGDEVKKKWKDPSIKWICGAYQRARRSFKSKCMMEYRNCQDGTMFVKLHDHRCANQTGAEEDFHGDHFFYEYKVTMSDESSDSSKDKSESTEEEEDESTSYY